MVDTPVEWNSTALQERQLLEPRLTARQGNGNMVDGQRTVEHTPWRRWGQGWHFHEREVVVIEPAIVVSAVKAHLGPLDVRTRVKLADLLEAHDLRPERVRLLHVADV